MKTMNTIFASALVLSVAGSALANAPAAAAAPAAAKTEEKKPEAAKAAPASK